MKELFAIAALALCPLISQAKPDAYSGPTRIPSPEIIQPETEADLGFTLSTGYDSQYDFDGVKYGTHLAWTRLDYEVPLTDELFLGLDVWYGNLLGKRFDDFDDELDYSVALTREFGITTSLSLVFTHYTFFGAIPDEPELGVEFWKRFGIVDFVLWYGYNFELEGHYLAADVSHEFVVNDWLSIVPSAQISYASGYDLERSGFNHAAARIGFPITFNDTTTLTPFIEAVFPIDALKAAGHDDNEIHGGVVLQIKF